MALDSDFFRYAREKVEAAANQKKSGEQAHIQEFYDRL